MSAQTLRHRQQLRQLRGQARHRQRGPIVRAGWLDRLATAAWRLHDGHPATWAALATAVLIGSGALAVGLCAAALGWRP